MTSILSAISGQFGKAIILGFFAPAVIVVTLWAIFIDPLLPHETALLRSLELLGETNWRLITATFAVVALTILLLVFNMSIIRFYEGYPWQFSALGQDKTRRYLQKARRFRRRANGLRALARYLEARRKAGVTPLAASQEEISRLQTLRAAYLQALAFNFPNREDLFLPTRLGNVIRSAEEYAATQYSMDTVTLWPRLAAVLPAEYAGLITDTRTSLNFMVSTSMLAGALAAATLLIGLGYPQHNLAQPAGLARWAVQGVVFGAASYVLYLQSISSARVWGNYLKGAFDLYRLELLKKLGYEEIPGNRAEEAGLWNRISVWMIYGPEKALPLPAYKPAPTTAQPTRFTSKLDGKYIEVTRGVLRQGDGESLQVVLSVTNRHPAQAALDGVLVDTAPEGFEYVWGSARMKIERGRRRPGQPQGAHSPKRGRRGAYRKAMGTGIQATEGEEIAVNVEGTNPYWFSIPRLQPKSRAVIAYGITLLVASVRKGKEA